MNDCILKNFNIILSDYELSSESVIPLNNSRDSLINESKKVNNLLLNNESNFVKLPVKRKNSNNMEETYKKSGVAKKLIENNANESSSVNEYVLTKQR